MKDTTIKHLAQGLKLLAGTAVLTWSMAAQALLIETHGGLELEVSMVSMPSSDNGVLSITECSDCKRQVLKTSADTTRYVVRDKSGKTDQFSRQDFAAELRRIDNRDAMLVVFYKLDNQTVTEVLLMSNVLLDSPINNTQDSPGQNASDQSGNGQSENIRPAGRSGGFSR